MTPTTRPQIIGLIGRVAHSYCSWCKREDITTATFQVNDHMPPTYFNLCEPCLRSMLRGCSSSSSPTYFNLCEPCLRLILETLTNP